MLVAKLKRPLVLLALALTVAGCAGPATRDTPYDPLEGVNRAVHGVNKATDVVVLRPASQVYGTVVPAPVRGTVNNFMANLEGPVVVVNDVLQGQIDDAGHNLFRFLVNSTLGVGGLFDPATGIGLGERDTDFGETLHVWGAGEGAYVELPFYGPSTVRDAAGLLVDTALRPTRQLRLSAEHRNGLVGLRAAEVLDLRYGLGTSIDQTLYESVDSYAQTRSLYLQNRRFTLGQDTAPNTEGLYDEIFE